MFLSKTSLANGILMQKVKDSDQKAFRELYNALWRPLYIRAYTILRDKELSEDILQEVWIGLWQRRKQIENGNIEAYLFRAVRFKAYNQLRNSDTRRTILQDLMATQQNTNNNNVDESIDLVETTEILLETINDLPPKCKEVFELSRFEGLKNKEISQKLCISQSTVENHIYNALKVLKTKVAPFCIGLVLLYWCTI